MFYIFVWVSTFFQLSLKWQSLNPFLKKVINNHLETRPISIISIFAKVLEKIVNSRLIIFLEENKLLSKNQFGFRKDLGTIDALYNVSKFISFFCSGTNLRWVT